MVLPLVLPYEYYLCDKLKVLNKKMGSDEIFGD